VERAVKLTFSSFDLVWPERVHAAPQGSVYAVLRLAVLSFIREFWMFLRVRKKYWLIPILITILFFGGLIVLTQGSAVAPFIYTLF
jgi:hypothetical protein